MTYPVDVKGVRQFLGFCNFFQRFIPNYSLYSSRLSSLLRKNSKWNGKEEIPAHAKEGFDYLKETLLSCPTSNNPKADKAFYMFTDASKGTEDVVGMIGWAICQKGEKDDEWYPISFGSRTIRDAENNYPINTLEQLAITEGYKKNYHMLNGRKLYIYCDNKPSVDKAAKTEKRILNMIQELINDTSAELIYLEGEKNVVPDFLSRYNAPRIHSCTFNPDKDKVFIEKIEYYQNKDKEIVRMKEAIKNKEQYVMKSYPNDNIDVKHGVLMVRHEDKWKPIIPNEYRHEYVANTHIDPIIGHMQKYNLTKRINNFAFVQQLDKIVSEVIQHCANCQQNKTMSKKDEKPPIQTIPIPNSIGERWHIDITGPFSPKENYDTKKEYDEEKDKTKQYIIGGVEEFTKYLVTKVIPSKRTKEVIDIVIRDIILRYGVPLDITSDNAYEFFAPAIREIMAIYNVTRINTSRYNPRSNGSIEKRWKVLKDVINRNYAVDDVNNLKRVVSAATFEINCLTCTSTNATPNEAMYGFIPKSPTMFPLYVEPNLKKADQMLVDKEKQRVLLMKNIRKTLVKKQLQRNAYTNQNATQQEFKVDDEVFIKVHKPTTPKSITPNFTTDKNGLPFVIQKVIGAYALLFDRSILASFYEHCSNIRKFTSKKTSPEALYYLRQGIFVPENQDEYMKQLFWDPKKEGDGPPSTKVFIQLGPKNSYIRIEKHR